MATDVPTDGGPDADADVVTPSYDAGPLAHLRFDEYPYMYPGICPMGRRFTFDLKNGVSTREACQNDASASAAFTITQADVDRLNEGFARLKLVPRSSLDDATCGFDGRGRGGWLYVTHENNTKMTVAVTHNCSPGPAVDYVATGGMFDADGMLVRLYSVADAGRPPPF